MKKTSGDDIFLDAVLRPKSFDEYIGQDAVKRNLHVMLAAAKKRREPVDHLLFYGQTGLGKTTLAHLVAQEMGAPMRSTSGPALERAGDLAAALSGLEENDILFIDEVHRLHHSVEEILYPAMESGSLHLVVGKGVGGQTLSIDLPRFTLIGATTRASMLSAPLRSRFGATFRLDYYELNDIERIIERSAGLMSVAISSDAVALLARASRFTPRIANRLLKRSRDFSEVHRVRLIDARVAREALNLLEMDALGLEMLDRRILETLITRFKNRPVGIETLSAAAGEERGVIEEICEPYLMKMGLLERTASGRMATEAARRHLDADRASRGR